MTEILIVLNDPPHGAERSYHGLGLAFALTKAGPEARTNVFLMADGMGGQGSVGSRLHHNAKD
jgi:sulfur relay (sulfurtransferase) complex TusBCD TusD component (DsrE family)